MKRYLVIAQQYNGNLTSRPVTVTATDAPSAIADAYRTIGPPIGTHRAIAFHIPDGGTAIPLVIEPGKWEGEPSKWQKVN